LKNDERNASHDDAGAEETTLVDGVELKPILIKVEEEAVEV